MEKTPNALRRHVVLLGETNAGKSTLLNALTGQDRSIVSAMAGTTTDPVRAPMELIPFGPIVLVDTAGAGDDTPLGRQRMQKTAAALRRADAAIFVAEAPGFDPEGYRRFREEELDHLLVFTKCDLADPEALEQLRGDYPAALQVTGDGDASQVRHALAELLAAARPEEDVLVGDLVPAGGSVVLVTPIDSAAPKGRLILPQVQVLRDCLDHGIHCTVCRETELEGALENLARVDLVITDSQVFAEVDRMLPRALPLTSFSMLLARQKGGFRQLLEGARALEELPEGARILMLEGCTHNRTHEDIGRVKLPALLKKRTGKTFRYDYFSGYDFPEDLSPYQMSIQCGGCMLNRREVAARLKALAEAGIPAGNYGVVLAWCAGILPRCSEIFAAGVTP